MYFHFCVVTDDLRGASKQKKSQMKIGSAAPRVGLHGDLSSFGCLARCFVCAENLAPLARIETIDVDIVDDDVDVDDQFYFAVWQSSEAVGQVRNCCCSSRRDGGRNLDEKHLTADRQICLRCVFSFSTRSRPRTREILPMWMAFSCSRFFLELVSSSCS